MDAWRKVDPCASPARVARVPRRAAARPACAL